jgi:hypothetical protein
VGQTTRGKGTKRMVLAEGQAPPLGVCVAAASPAAVTLLERTRDRGKVTRRRGERRRPHQPERLMADRGSDSNPARALLVTRELEPIIPKRRNHRTATQQDGRTLRRDKRRWSIERPNSWRQNFRRLVARSERKVKNCEALVHLACALVTLTKV